ncbi:unnamed protein product [Musa acuminata subsp. burmannicoides]
MNGISMTRVPYPTALDLKKKIDILSSLYAKGIIRNNHKYQSKLISNFSEEK